MKIKEQICMATVNDTMFTFISGKKLLACRTAIDSFKSIVATVGGLEEKQRSRSKHTQYMFF